MSAPTSAQPTSALEESPKEFDTRMYNMVSLLATTDTFFFYKRMSKSTATEALKGPLAYCLEFPRHFIEKHGDTFDKDVTFCMKDTERTWPIKVTVRSFRKSKPRVFAYGDGGWKTFLTDNQIKVEDILIFTLISYSKFRVFIGRAPVEVHPGSNDDGNEEDQNEDEEDDQEDSTSPWWNDQAPNTCRVCKQAPPFPRFGVTIRSRHSSLAVPGCFWQLHRNELKCNALQLKGPNKAIFIVKAKRTYDEEEGKLSVCLDSGWEAFRVANKLRVGDVLEFFLVGNSCFTVVLFERMEKY